MAICPPCARAADAEQGRLRRADDAGVADEITATGHDPAICRDHAIQSAGCGCAHKPVGTAHEKEN
jgi:hypothetical protein